jgi:chromosome segregation ATPase
VEDPLGDAGMNETAKRILRHALEWAERELGNQERRVEELEAEMAAASERLRRAKSEVADLRLELGLDLVVKQG